MKVHLKRLRDQVVVITGATSGIGLATARMAARAGSRLMLAARNEKVLREITEEIRSKGGEAHYLAVDVGKEGDVRRLAGEAVGHFGGFDTWVNNAGVSIYAKLLETPVEDARRVFETNFWGLVYGSQAACEHLRHHGGALINIGSVVSDRAIPMQGIYSASKQAIKGFTDALRMELEEEGAPISVTLIKPASIDTPYLKHAANMMEEEPTFPPPVYAPELVAKAILRAAEHPVRDLHVGSASKFMAMMGYYAPRSTDKYMSASMIDQQKSGERTRGDRPRSLYRSMAEGQESGNYEGMVIKRDPYTAAALHPVLAVALGFGASLGVAALLRRRSGSDVPSQR